MTAEVTVESVLATLAEQQTAQQEAMTHMWVLVCGAMVLMMHAGFALLEAGLCRMKNVESVLMKNLLTPLIGSVCWCLASGRGGRVASGVPLTVPCVKISRADCVNCLCSEVA